MLLANRSPSPEAAPTPETARSPEPSAGEGNQAVCEQIAALGRGADEARLHQALPRLDALVGASQLPELQAAWARLYGVLGPHVAREDAALFPRLDAIGCEGTADTSLLAEMERTSAEHGVIGALGDELRAAAAGTPVGAEIASWVEVLASHAAGEDAQFAEARGGVPAATSAPEDPTGAL